jgi:hypothetical protein
LSYIYIITEAYRMKVSTDWSCICIYIPLPCYWSQVVKTPRLSLNRLVSYIWTTNNESIQDTFIDKIQVSLAQWLSPRNLIFCIFNCRNIVN